MKKLFLALMLVLGFGLNVFASNNTPESVILGFAAAMQNGDIEKAKSYLDKKSFIKPKNIMKPQLGTKDTLEREINLFNSFLLYTDSENGNAHNPKDWTIKVEKNTNGHNNYELYLINSQLKQRWTSNTGINYSSSKSFEVIKVGKEWKIAGWI